MPWAPVVGARAAAELLWLEQTAGPRAVQKFLGGKLRHPRFGGRYLTGITDIPEGRKVIGDLLRRLRKGQTIPLCDVDSYYAAGKRWPLGMAIQEGRLIDVWPRHSASPSDIPSGEPPQ